jgi:hypothetical protein
MKPIRKSIASIRSSHGELALPVTKGAVTVTAQDQFALGGGSVTFTETAN